MQKDVIYIDVEDDITAIIGKVKDAKHKVVALVPPKRIGVLQSAVNLRLLARTADNADKRLVLITGNGALAGLAASAKIPVAKNLQSKPELAEVPALKVDDDDVIEGDQLPVGEHAKTTEGPTAAATAVPVSAIEGIDIDGERSANASPKEPTGRKAGGKKGIKVPDFGTFRKKMFLLAGGGVLLLAFLIWAIWFAPRATVVVSAQTADQELSVPVTIGPSVVTDVEQGHLKSLEQQEKATQTIEFAATGTKDVGEKAKGTVRFTSDSYSALLLGINIPAGTTLTSSSGKTFTTDRAVQLSISAGNSDSTGVTATESGESFNGATGSVSGAPSSVNANFTGSTSGGTSKVVKIVLQADVEKAKEQLAEQNTDAEKKKLQAKFEQNVMVIDSSFKTSGGDPQSSPAIGQEAPDGKAKLTQETTYTLSGVADTELDSYLDALSKETVTDSDRQKVYDNGADTAKFTDFEQGEGNQAGTVTLTATAQVGPKIDDEAIKEQVKGKRTGEVIGDLKAIDGVSDVAVKLSPFWVTSIPDDSNKITVEFKLLSDD